VPSDGGKQEGSKLSEKGGAGRGPDHKEGGGVSHGGGEGCNLKQNKETPVGAAPKGSLGKKGKHTNVPSMDLGPPGSLLS